MPHPQCRTDENIVRAIHSAHWDASANRKSSAIFRGRDLSVSRLAILGLGELFRIFHATLDESPNGAIVAVGEINVGNLQQIALDYHHPTALTVEPDPREDNPAHAVIPQRITRGLAKVIIEQLKIHEDQFIGMSDDS